MPRYFDLRLAQNFLQVADAKRTIEQQIHDAQPGAVAEAFMDAD
jgi:hypothetical protein